MGSCCSTSNQDRGHRLSEQPINRTEHQRAGSGGADASSEQDRQHRLQAIENREKSSKAKGIQNGGGKLGMS